MTTREQFKYGFILRCLEEGLDEAGVAARAAAAEKRALDLGGPLEWARAIGGLGGGALNLGLASLPVAGATGLLGGGALGYMAGKATDPGYDADDVRRQELIAAYGQAADDMDEDLATRKELAS